MTSFTRHNLHFLRLTNTNPLDCLVHINLNAFFPKIPLLCTAEPKKREKNQKLCKYFQSGFSSFFRPIRKKKEKHMLFTVNFLRKVENFCTVQIVQRLKTSSIQYNSSHSCQDTYKRFLRSKFSHFHMNCSRCGTGLSFKISFPFFVHCLNNVLCLLNAFC